MTSLIAQIERRPAAGYLLALVACTAALFGLFDLAHLDLGAPFVYTGDGLFYGMTVQTVLHNGWYLGSSRLGMPFGQVLLDFPVPDSLSFLLLRGLGFVAGDWPRTMNLFFLAGYPLTVLASLYVLRRLGVTYWPALMASLLYAFASYHTVRGQFHLLYTCYYTVPLMAMVLLWLCAGEMVLLCKADLLRGKTVAAVLICAATASTGGVYFAFFACALLLAVAIRLGVRARAWQPAVLPLGLLGVTFAVLVLNLLPSILYLAEHGSVGTAERGFHEAEVFGLRLVQMLLPVQGHRVPAFADLRQIYDAAPLFNQEAAVSLGLVGSLGLLCALAWLFFVPRSVGADPRRQRLHDLGMLTGVALLVAAPGGLGAVFAFFVSAQIRGYDRIVVFVAFFALATVALVLDRLRTAWCSRPRRTTAFAGATLLLATLGLLDQTPSVALPNAQAAAASFARDHAFFEAMEAALPPGAMVFQLPRVEFPEGGPYDGLRPYLHTKTLRFTAGAMRGRRASRWQRHVLSLPLSDMTDTIRAAGFAAILVDRWLLGGDAAATVSTLETHLGVVASSSATSRFALLRLPDLSGASSASGDAGVRRQAALHPVFVEWGRGFSAIEGGSGGGRWVQEQADLQLTNDLPRVRHVELAMSLTASAAGSLVVDSDLWSETVAVGPVPVRVVRRVEVPPGEHQLHWRCDAPRLELPHDGRSVVLRVADWVVRELE